MNTPVPVHRLASALLPLLLVSAATIDADQLVLSGGSVLVETPLPAGASDAEPLELSDFVRELTYLDDGRSIALRDILDDEDRIIGYALAEIHGDGMVQDIGMIEPPDDAFGVEDPVDLVVDSQGRLFYLASVLRYWNPPDGYYRLAELDLETASTLSVRTFEWPAALYFLARAPSGLWAATQNGLELLDPDTGHFTFVRQLDALANDGESDSTGALWLYGEGVCSPPCFLISRFDPATGSLRRITTPRLNPAFVNIRDLTVRRRCEGSETRLCLQGGRFAVEIGWRDFENRRGEARVTPSRSAESGVFYFFDPANWELTVKVLNACGDDAAGHFWVFASGSTNVEYRITVTDLETGAVQTYENPLGRTAVTVTDTTAFTCTPP